MRRKVNGFYATAPIPNAEQWNHFPPLKSQHTLYDLYASVNGHKHGETVGLAVHVCPLPNLSLSMLIRSLPLKDESGLKKQLKRRWVKGEGNSVMKMDTIHFEIVTDHQNCNC